MYDYHWSLYTSAAGRPRPPGWTIATTPLSAAISASQTQHSHLMVTVRLQCTWEDAGEPLGRDAGGGGGDFIASPMASLET